jgi:hypothetical protein
MNDTQERAASMARHPAGKGRPLPNPEPIALVAADGALVPIHKTATVTVKKAVDGTRKRKARSDKGEKRERSVTDLTLVKVDPRVMTAARQARRPGQILVIVDAECVRLVNA